MPALYLHVPFCRQACTYCDFHFTTARRGRGEMVDAIAREIGLRHTEMPAGLWTSVYFGGGTPSLLGAERIEQLLTAAAEARPIAGDAEVTLEANPDDLTPEALAAFAKTRINRLSVGVQSFREADLRFMNRAHDAEQAARCIGEAQAAGFRELSVDLIYGTPGLDDAGWRDNLRRAVDAGVPHLSCYALTVEERTALAHQIRTGRTRPLDEAQAARQMELAMDVLAEAGYEQYEVSSWALPGHRARHNSAYWLGSAYLGVGPSAHSFDGEAVRSWNVRHNPRYVAAIAAGELPTERETLTRRDRYHELVLTRLRTAWGVDRAEVERLGYGEHFARELTGPLARGLAEEHAPGSYRLTPRGRLVADAVTAELFADD